MPEIPRRPSEEVPMFVPEEEEKVPEVPARGTAFLLEDCEILVQELRYSLVDLHHQ